MTERLRTGAGPAGPVPVAGDVDAEIVVAGIDAEIMVNWLALRSNPDLRAGNATAAIDRLLDDRLRRSAGQAAATGRAVLGQPAQADRVGLPERDVAACLPERDVGACFPGQETAAGLSVPTAAVGPRARRAAIVAALELIFSPAGDAGGSPAGDAGGNAPGR